MGTSGNQRKKSSNSVRKPNRPRVAVGEAWDGLEVQVGNESEDTRSFQRKQISSTMYLCIGVVAVFAAYAIYKDNTVLIDRVLDLVIWVIAAVIGWIVGKQSAKPLRE